MQPGEANRFSTHSKAGAGAQGPRVSKNVIFPAQASDAGPPRGQPAWGAGSASPARGPRPGSPAGVGAFSSPTPGPRPLTPDASDRVGYLMVLPYILHIAVFVGYPLAFAFVLIFHRWNIYTPMKWVGLGNIRLLLSDPLVWRALGNTLYFLVIHIPLQLVIALGLAQL
ncbi:MAG: hypothetical protein M3Q91_19110, partial [Acidobacteriota bacterium]|nr:hypothetical protein [Acidobacteriota bacterium]